MAKVSRLYGYADLSLVVHYARQFGLDPDEVFWRTEMRSLVNIMALTKEEDEYNERYSDIYRKINEDGRVRPGASASGGES